MNKSIMFHSSRIHPFIFHPPCLQVMPTIISSACLWFSAQHRRWLSPDEILTFQGFPVRVSQSYGVVCCSFAARDVFQQSDEALWAETISQQKKLCLTCRPARQSLLQMAGNSMHLNVSGLAILFCLTQVMIDQDLLKMCYDAHRMRRNPRRVKSVTGSSASRES